MGETRGTDGSRLFELGRLQFRVVTSHLADQELVESLLADLPSPCSSPDSAVQIGITRTEAGSDRSWVVAGPWGTSSPIPTTGAWLKTLISSLNLAALDLEEDCLHLHAAAASRRDTAVIIAAERDVGKTTTVAHLVSQGCDFITDETVRLEDTSNRVSGFPKPLSIKPTGETNVAHLEPWLLPPASGEFGFRFVPIGASGATIVATAQARLVVILRRSDNQLDLPTVRELHPADAVVALMQETIDAQRYGPAAKRLAQLAAQCNCYEIVAGTPTATAAEIDELLRRPQPDCPPVTELSAAGAVHDAVVSIAIGDRMVIHHTGNGHIFALDETASQVWQQLGGWQDAKIDLEGPVVAKFLSQLESFSVLMSSWASTKE